MGSHAGAWEPEKSNAFSRKGAEFAEKNKKQD